MTNKINLDNLWVVILAAGKGKRINASRDKNKVTYEINGKPMLLRTFKNLEEANVKNIVVVVGYAKESVLKLLDKEIKTVEQKKRLGTGHAVKIALKKIPNTACDVLVLNGDDSFLYTPDILKKLFEIHQKEKSAITFLTLEVDDPTGLGRILRNKQGKVVGIVEEKDANKEQRKIKEINPACYLFSKDFLKSYINKIPKSKISREYYVVSLIELAAKKNEKIEAFTLSNLKWRGVNTHDELKEAEMLTLE